MVQAVDNSKGTSVDLKKQIMEQTQAMMDATTSPIAAKDDQMFEPETEETEATEQTEEAEAEETETKGEETTEEAETPPPKTETLHKLKVEGKEEEWPYEKVISFAQQGRFLEKEKQRLNEEKRRLEEERSKIQQPQYVDPAKAKEQFLNALAEDPFGTLGMAMNTFVTQKEAQTTQERKAEREFEKSRREADSETWNLIKPIYEEYRDEGMPREQAYLMAENDLLRKALTTAKTKGVKEGTEKAKAKQRAEIPQATTRAKVRTKAPSPDELKKLSSKDMRKHLPHAPPNEEW